MNSTKNDTTSDVFLLSYECGFREIHNHKQQECLTQWYCFDADSSKNNFIVGFVLLTPIAIRCNCYNTIEKCSGLIKLINKIERNNW